MTEIPIEIFFELMHNLKCETGNDLDCIGFRVKYKGYEVSFHGELENNYDVVVDDFGKMVSGKWVGVNPRAYQLGLMNIKLHRKHSEIMLLNREKLQQESDSIEREMEIERYGIEGATYSKYH